MAIQNLLLILVQAGCANSYGAALLIPTLRTDDAFLGSVITLCYSWVGMGQQTLSALSILVGFASPCNSADIPAARSTVVLIRKNQYFCHLLQASLGQVGPVVSTAPAFEIAQLVPTCDL